MPSQTVEMDERFGRKTWKCPSASLAHATEHSSQTVLMRDFNEEKSRVSLPFDEWIYNLIVKKSFFFSLFSPRFETLHTKLVIGIVRVIDGVVLELT